MSMQALQRRTFAAVYVRQQAKVQDEKDLWNSADISVRRDVKATLLHVLSNESSSFIGRKICDLIAIIASRDLNGNWPDLLPHVKEGCFVDAPGTRAMYFDLFAKICEFAPRGVDEGLVPFAEYICVGLNDNDATVRVFALKAGTSLLYSVEEEFQTNIAGIIEPMLVVLENCVSEGREEDIEECLQSLHDLARKHAAIFSEHMEGLVGLLTTIAGEDSADESLRAAALQMLITLGERAKSAVRQVASYMPSMLELSFHFMQQLEENLEEWSVDQEEDAATNAVMTGSVVLSRLPPVFGPKKFTAAFVPFMQHHLRSDTWQAQHAALLAISAALESAKAELAPYFFSATSGKSAKASSILSALSNSSSTSTGANGSLMRELIKFLAPGKYHPRVQWSAITCISAVGESYPKKFARHAEEIIKALSSLLSVDSNARVISHSALAIVVILRSSPPGIDKIRDDLLTKLVALLELDDTTDGNVLKVKINVFSCLSALAAVSDTDFSPYYREIFPSILAELDRLRTMQCSSQEQLFDLCTLRGKIAECVGFIAKAVGADDFDEETAHNVLRKLLEGLEEIKTAEDPASQYFNRAIYKIAEVMGDKFGPYMSHVIPRLIEAAKLDDVVSMVEASESTPIEVLEKFSAENGYDTQIVDIKGVGPMRYAIHTTLLMEKTVAVQLLSEYAIEFREAFAPFAMASLEATWPLTTFIVSTEIRMSSISSMSAFLDCAKCAIANECSSTSSDPAVLEQAYEEKLRPLWDNSCSAICTGMTNGNAVPTTENYVIALESLIASIDLLPFSISQDQIKGFCNLLHQLLENSVQRRKLRTEAFEQENLDEEDKAELDARNEEENEILEAASMLSTSLMKNNTEEYMPEFEKELAGSFAMLMDIDENPSVWLSSLIVFSDVIDEGGDWGLKYIDLVLPRAIGLAVHPSHEVRRAALFALAAVIRRVGRDMPEDMLEEVIQVLRKGTSVEEKDDDLYDQCEAATDNGLSALIALVRSLSFVDNPVIPQSTAAEVVEMWFHKLPRRYDEDEAAYQHEFLVSLCEEQYPPLMGEGNSNLPAVLSVMAQVIRLVEEEEEAVATVETVARMRNFFISVSNAIPDNVRNDFFASIKDEDKAILSATASS